MSAKSTYIGAMDCAKENKYNNGNKKDWAVVAMKSTAAKGFGLMLLLGLISGILVNFSNIALLYSASYQQRLLRQPDLRAALPELRALCSNANTIVLQICLPVLLAVVITICMNNKKNPILYYCAHVGAAILFSYVIELFLGGWGEIVPRFSWGGIIMSNFWPTQLLCYLAGFAALGLASVQQKRRRVVLLVLGAYLALGTGFVLYFAVGQNAIALNWLRGILEIAIPFGIPVILLAVSRAHRGSLLQYAWQTLLLFGASMALPLLIACGVGNYDAMATHYSLYWRGAVICFVAVLTILFCQGRRPVFAAISGLFWVGLAVLAFFALYHWNLYRLVPLFAALVFALETGLCFCSKGKIPPI